MKSSLVLLGFISILKTGFCEEVNLQKPIIFGTQQLNDFVVVDLSNQDNLEGATDFKQNSSGEAIGNRASFQANNGQALGNMNDNENKVMIAKSKPVILGKQELSNYLIIIPNSENYGLGIGKEPTVEEISGRPQVRFVGNYHGNRGDYSAGIVVGNSGGRPYQNKPGDSYGNGDSNNNKPYGNGNGGSYPNKPGGGYGNGNGGSNPYNSGGNGNGDYNNNKPYGNGNGGSKPYNNGGNGNGYYNHNKPYGNGNSGSNPYNTGGNGNGGNNGNNGPYRNQPNYGNSGPYQSIGVNVPGVAFQSSVNQGNAFQGGIKPVNTAGGTMQSIFVPGATIQGSVLQGGIQPVNTAGGTMQSIIVPGATNQGSAFLGGIRPVNTAGGTTQSIIVPGATNQVSAFQGGIRPVNTAGGAMQSVIVPGTTIQAGVNQGVPAIVNLGGSNANQAMPITNLGGLIDADQNLQGSFIRPVYPIKQNSEGLAGIVKEVVNLAANFLAGSQYKYPPFYYYKYPYMQAQVTY